MNAPGTESLLSSWPEIPERSALLPERPVRILADAVDALLETFDLRLPSGGDEGRWIDDLREAQASVRLYLGLNKAVREARQREARG